MLFPSSKIGLLIIFLYIFNVFATIRLDIKRDGTNYLHVSSIVSIISGGNYLDSMDPRQISDEQMRGLVKQAFEDMRRILDADGVEENDQPGAMIALAVGEQIYFSSSAKGLGGFNKRYPDSPVRRSLERCMETNGGTHKSGGACGEPHAIQTYIFDHHPVVSLPTAARIIAWNIDQQTGQPHVADPCGGTPANVAQGIWGCNRFLEDYKVTNIILDGPVGDIPDDWTTRTRHLCLSQFRSKL